MELSVFEGMNKNELSMIEVAHAILEQREDVMDFTDLVNQIQVFLEKSDLEIRESLAQFYTDLNIDGSFISLGENRWGLRSWYAIDSIDEELNHGFDDEDEENQPRRKRKKVNAFINDDEDVIDYNDDDPEDTDLSDDDDDEDDLFDDEDEDEEIAEYDSDLKEIIANEDDEEELPSGIEEDLTIIDDDEEEDEYYDEEDEDM
ncbi:DNA-directed RNA polymerase subunit delta [Enterococcus cecorum]|uniref:Probable DNA-directed RNA polymerase subunit delta n=1 Tax=Enterococcus cecorum TaxID=44008 RepID=A0A366SLF9_9ENTE|nr:DNA-directed RNA polymerase subunit delta [Enterococcus cecorum]RBR28261.1 DNA-directed RNA polymerase subunit delta [Enterococcus cecorum]RBR31506.1 DNA-directed RNA polymerase subunit delta [Enterococcus cecorum]RBR32045.1 DNA-directed RNA polymerase subunit delta [Enterococcus cecorum]RBR33245.1 DNA-directed RNA polymerase subunit delta [Enterococcus cecorum]RBR33655.1 DNA-directed RNA polymerase subunit delta [Enterococcus cecorum]